MVNEDRFEMKNRYYIFIALLALSLVSCQKEELYTGPCDVKVKAYVQDEVTVSRAYTAMPTDYADFAADLFVSVADGSIAPISTTMTKQGEALTANLRLEQGDYYIYGYLPQTDGANLTFNTNTATMTIPNIAGLSTTDALVIRKGDKLTILATDKSKNATLLMDHLMAKITPRFYIDSKYAQMRSIRIKKVEFSIDGAMTYTANVAFDNTKSTISWNTTWTPGATSDMEVVAYENAEPTETDTLKTAKAAALACGACYVCPAQPIAGLNMTVTYDVYDTKGQLVRLDAEATNKMKIKVDGNTLAKLDAGKNYQLNIRIVPTYLYVLSDNDEESVLTIND